MAETPTGRRAERRAETTERRRRDPHAHHRLRILVRTVMAVALAVGVMVGGPWLYARFVAAEPRDELSLSSPSPEAAPQVPTGPLDIDGTWLVQPGSEAGYRLREVLSGEEVVVVGRTESVTGEVEVEADRLTTARVVVDAGSISTDESARDAFFRRALDTTSFPEATFELTEPVDVSTLAAGDEPLTTTVSGELTLHGVTSPVAVELEAQRTATGVEVVGQVPVTLADFGLSAPDLGWVVVDPAGTVEIRLLLAR